MKRTRLLNIVCSMLVGVIFMIAMLLVMVLSGAVSIQRTDLVFSTGSASAMYDGKPLTNHRWDLEFGALKPGHEAVVEVTGEQTSAGESSNTIKVQIIDAVGADVTGDYNISYNLGRLEVKPKPVSVTSYDATKVYDGSALTNSKYDISGLVSGHSANVVITGSQREIGFSSNTIESVKITDRSGMDVTNNYQLTKTEGVLAVTDEEGNGGVENPPGSEGGVDFGDTNENIDPDKLKNTILYRVFSDKTGKIYLKNKSYGNYTGTGFKDALEYTALINGKYSASYLTSFALQAKNASLGQLTVERINDSAYVLPYYMATLINNGYNIQTSDVGISGTAVQYTLNYYLDNVIPTVHNSYIYSSYEKIYREFVYENYLEIDDTTLAYLESFMLNEGLNASDADIINKVAEVIQKSATYNMEYDTMLDKTANITVAFLRDYKEGVCRHYAMAATMLYRALGIPARYTVGAVADAEAGEWVDVTALQSHAWVEVYIDGIGWQMVEVTGGGSAGGNGGSGEGGEGNEGGASSEGGVDFGESSSDLTPEELMNIILYRVYSDKTGKIYLKNKSYGDYTGRGFAASEKYTSLLNGKYSASYLTSFALNASGASLGHMQIENIESGDYVLPYYIATMLYGGYGTQESDIESIGSAGLYSVDYYLEDVTPTVHTLYSYMVFERNYRSFVYDKYTEIDEDTKNFFVEFMNQSGISRNDPELIHKIAAYIQSSAKYNMEYDRGLDSSDNIAISFIRDYKEGVCRHYAMAATMLYRALGIPARYTVGAVADAEAGEWVDVTALQSHAWVEVYIDGIGWQMVEVTGGGSAGGNGGSSEGGEGNEGGGSGEGGEDDEKQYIIRPIDVLKAYDGTAAVAKAELVGFDDFAKQGYRYENLIVSGSRTEVGTSEIIIESITIYDSEGNDVTDKFEFKNGTIRVYWEFTANSDSASFIVGNIAGQNVTISDGSIQSGHTWETIFHVDYDTVGKQMNVFEIIIKDENGEDVTSLYKVNYKYGILDIQGKPEVPKIKIHPVNVYMIYNGTAALAKAEIADFGNLAKEGYWYENLVVSGSRTEVGKSNAIIESVNIYDADGNDVTDQFEFTPGIIHVYYWEIYVASDSASFEYGEIGGQNINFWGDGIQTGHPVDVIYKAKYTAGKHSNVFEISIKDGNGKNINVHYKISYSYGTLNISNRAITVTAGSATKIYDGTPLTCNTYEIEGSLAEGHEVYLFATEGEQTNIGRSENVISAFRIRDEYGNDVTKNYNIDMKTGTLKVTRK